MIYKEAFRWLPDDKDLTTHAVVLVSSCGDIKTSEYKRWNELNGSYNNMKESKRSQSMRGNYKRVSLCNKSYAVHRLVAMAWIDNPENKRQVNHIDGNKLNNNASNLEWCTASENQQHAMRTGLKVGLSGDNCPASKLNAEKVKDIRERLKTSTPKEVAELYSVSPFTIRDIKRGTTWKGAE